MARKYNSKKTTLLGSYLKTDFQDEKKPTMRYAALTNDWQKKVEEKTDIERNNELLKSAFHGNKKRFRLALYDGATNINATDKFNNNSLILAVYSGHEELVKFIVNINKNEKGNILEHITPIELNHLNDESISALHLAVKLNNTRITKLLLDAKADANIIGAYKETPIFEAVKQDNNEMVDIILNYHETNKAYVNAKNREEQTPLMIACQNRYRQESMLVLLKNGADIFLQDNKGRNALMHACNNNNSAMIDILLRSAEKSGRLEEYLNTQDEKGITPLMIVSKRGNREAVRVFLTRGADPFIRDNKGLQSCDYAQACGKHTCEEITKKVMGLYTQCNEIFTDSKDRELFLSKEFNKIAKQNRVINSCVQ